ncbi:MAG: alpha-mannosidase [Clostridia bacterium]|nr:alpha-mannosidase [Clostridia bacterium]
MAHVKVVRRSMRPEEWTDLRFTWLQRGIEADREEIGGITIRDARQIAENEYEYDPAGERPLKKGDLYFTPDGTVFMRMKAVIPERMRSQQVYFSLKTAAEMIVKINGRYAGGIDPNRERFPLRPSDGYELNIEIEAYNRSKPDDERNPASLSKRGCRQIFEGAYLTTIRDNVQSLVYDYTLLMDIAHSEYFSEDYRRFLFKELSRALDYVDFETFEGVDEAAAYVDRVIYRNTDFRGSGDVALVGHSHLDIAYYWRRIHAVQKNARTVLIQLRLMDQYPEFRYTHTQAYTYETLEKYYPDLFEELKKRVKEGRFEPVGAMYVEPDCNVPSAESLTRQFLYGQRFFRRAFGLTIDNAWLPDVFGNSWIMPQILQKSGVKFFVSNKMSTWNDTNRFPHNNFIWRGIDGSEVYACVPPTHFITWNMPSQIQENWEAYQDKEAGGQTLSMYGYGDGGSGVTEEMLELARRFEKLSIMPKTELTGGAAFLRKNLEGNPNLSVWDGELYLEMHRGTFTTKSDIKKANRALEFRLREAELLFSLQALKGGDYPADTLRECWKKLLLNQFHDILPGSHIHPVYEDAMRDYREIGEKLDALLAPLRADRWFNSLNFRREWLAFIPDEKGPVTRDGRKGFWSAGRLHGLTAGEAAPLPETPDWLKVREAEGGLSVETPLYDIRFNPDGSMASLHDRSLERDWVRPGCGFNQLRLWADHPGMYDAWDILPNYRDVPVAFEVAEPLRLTYRDGSSCELTCALKTEKSSWRMVIRLFAAHPGIEVEHLVDWHEKHVLAKVNFGADVLTRELLCDTSAGYIRRPLTKNTSWDEARFEVCHHKWMDLSEADAGLAVINSGKYGVGLEGKEVSLSLLRSTIRPDITSDMGSHDIRYLILPHAGDAVAAGINRTAFEYNVPLTPVDPEVPLWLRSALEASTLYLQSMKRSEDGSMLILRLSEQDGRRGSFSLGRRVKLLNLLEDVEGEAETVAFRPFEIVTIGVDM